MGPLKEPSFDNVPPAAPARGVAARRGMREGTEITPMASRRGVSQPEDRHETRTTRRPYLLEGDILLVRNIETAETGNAVWRFRWDHREYIVRPGETKPIPFPAVVNMMGDPRSAPGEIIRYRSETGERGAIPSRYEQLVGLFARYGIETESVDQLVAYAPKIDVRTMTGEPIVFPVQNPNMAPWPVPMVAEAGREQPLNEREAIGQLQAENAALANEVAQMRELVNARLGAEPQEPAQGIADVLGGAPLDEGPRTRI